MNFHISVAHLFDTIAKSVYQLYKISKWAGLLFNELRNLMNTWSQEQEQQELHESFVNRLRM